MKSYADAAAKFYRSKSWINTRALYIKKVHGLCERCLAQGEFTPGVIVHHKIHLDDEKLKDPNIALCFNNLELLCQDCHNKEHHKTEPKRRYKYDESGALIPTEETK